MVKRVYIQQQNRTYLAPCGFSCHEGFRFLGKDVQPFEEAQLPDLLLTSETLVHGWVRTVQQALVQMGKAIPAALDYPDELASYLATPVRMTTLGEVHAAWRAETPEPVFVKPVAQKLFTGHTVERFSHLAETTPFPPDTPVWVAQVVDHVSEYRCFVHEHRLVGFKHYRGDPWLLPDRRTINQMIRDFAPAAPIAYGLDVGLIETGDGHKTCLVEINDCYALGNYGFDPIAYCEMLEARWLQLMAG